LIFRLGRSNYTIYTDPMIRNLLPKRIWLVNRDFQFRYTGAGVAAGLASTALTMTLLLYPLFSFKILTVGMFLPLPVIIAMICAAILNFVIQVLFGIILTHRIAGPMFSIVRQLRLIAQGNWRVSLRQRQGDELQTLVRHLNEMSESLVVVAESDLQTLATIKQSMIESEANAYKLGSILISIDQLMDTIESRIRNQ
jgi:methyl-accepting chemotaxis protein